MVESGSSHLFLFSPFSSPCWDWGTLTFQQAFSSFLIHPLYLPHRYGRASQCCGLALWLDRGSKQGQAGHGPRCTRRYKHLPRCRDPANNISIFSNRAIVLAVGRLYTRPDHDSKGASLVAQSYNGIPKVGWQKSGIARGERRLKKQVTT